MKTKKEDGVEYPDGFFEESATHEQTEQPTTEVVPVEQEQPTEVAQLQPRQVNLPNVSVFSNAESFELAQRQAKVLSASQLVPKTYQGNIADCIIAIETASRIGASPLMVMQNLYIVHGKPAWSSNFLIATLNASPNWGAIGYEENTDNGGSCRAYAEDKRTGELKYGIWVSMAMAKAEGWSEKSGSKWKTMPQLMLRYRAAAFFVRQFAPEISMGIHTYEEVIDVQSKPYVEPNKSKWHE
jgi:hypothetical protein